MITQIIKINNSEDIRIPKSLLEQSGLYDEVEIEVRKNRLSLNQQGFLAKDGKAPSAKCLKRATTPC